MISASTPAPAMTANRVNVRLLERHPERRQLRELVPVHEVGDARRGLDGGADRVRGLQLQEHRHAIAAQAEEHALPQAQDPAVAPAQHQPQRDERVGQVLADQIQAEDDRAAAGTAPGRSARPATATPSSVCACRRQRRLLERWADRSSPHLRATNRPCGRIIRIDDHAEQRQHLGHRAGQEELAWSTAPARC